MKINWKVRFKNKTWLITFIAAVVALVYQILGLCGIIPTVSQDTLLSIAGMMINLLVMLGVVVDPTTAGASDSERALSYDKPAEDNADEQ